MCNHLINISRLGQYYSAYTGIILLFLLKPLEIIIRSIGGAVYRVFLRFTVFSMNLLYPHVWIQQKRVNSLKRDMLLYRDSVGRKGVELYLTVSSAQRLFQGKTVLDFGCGVGGRTRELLRYTPEKIMGIDISRRNIEMASHGLSDRRLLFVAGDLSCLKGEELFDTIVSFTVFEHIDRELLPQILKRMSRLIKRDGKIVIVFNHYDCMFGSHVKEWVFHPWPQLIFRESELFAYWTDKNMIAASKASRCFFPQDYRHGIEGHNNDCYMNLNKIGIREFQNMIEDSGLKMLTRYDCSRIPLPLQLIGREHLQGSSVYLIER